MTMAWREGSYRAPARTATLTPEQAFVPPLIGVARLRAPAALHAAGDLALLGAPARISLVGARQASADGLVRAARLARQLVRRGVVVVSGLARGVDHAAHTAAMAAGGRTIAVIGTPLERCYPAAHARLQEAIYERHLLVSQLAPGQRVTSACFPARNRTMAMLAHAAVVVEAGDGSGSLSHAAEVLTLGRPLFIPRRVAMDERLRWPSLLLRQGARVLDDVDQLVAAVAGA